MARRTTKQVQRAIGFVFVCVMVTSANDAAATRIAVEQDGAILVCCSSVVGDEVIRVDPVTGAQSVVSGDAVGGGPPLFNPEDLALEGAGSIVVTVWADGPGDRVMRVDPLTGDRTIVSDASLGTGPLFLEPRGVAVGEDGALFVTDTPLTSDVGVFRVDPSNGDRSIVSNASRGSGPNLDLPRRIVVEPDGNLVVVDGGLRAVVRIDPATGDRTVVSDDVTGGGPPLRGPGGIDVEGDGTLVLADNPPVLQSSCIGGLICLKTGRSVARVDPIDGDRRRVSGGGICLTLGLSCITPYFGRIGAGPLPDGEGWSDVAVESDGSYLATGLNLTRINPRTGQRTIITSFRDGSTAARSGAGGHASGVTTSSRQEALRLSWLGLSPVQRQAAGERLYAAAWKAMREALGDEHPDTLEATYGMAALAASRGQRARAVGLLRRLASAGWTPPDIRNSPDFAALHGDPDLRALLAPAP